MTQNQNNVADKLNELNGEYENVKAEMFSRGTGNILVSWGGEGGMSAAEIALAVAAVSEDPEDYFIRVSSNDAILQKISL